MNQNEIWLIDLNPTVGAELQKTRPAVIINDNALGKLPLKIIVPITDWKEHYSKAPWMIKLLPGQSTGLTKVSSIDCFQIPSISVERFVKKIGEVNLATSDSIKTAVARLLSMEI